MAHSLFKVSSLTALLMVASTAIAQEEKDNQLDVNLQMLSHGEMRLGGFDATEHDDNDLEKAYFLMQRSRLVVDFLRAGQEQMSGCRDHAVYSYSDLMEDVRPQSNTMFVWHARMFSEGKLGDKPMKMERIGNSTLDASLYLKAFIRDGKYQVKAEYNSNEYSQQLIAQFLESYEAVVEGFISRELLRDIDIATASQVKTLDSFNLTDVEYDATQTIVSLFRNQAKATPGI